MHFSCKVWQHPNKCVAVILKIRNPLGDLLFAKNKYRNIQTIINHRKMSWQKKPKPIWAREIHIFLLSIREKKKFRKLRVCRWSITGNWQHQIFIYYMWLCFCSLHLSQTNVKFITIFTARTDADTHTQPRSIECDVVIYLCTSHNRNNTRTHKHIGARAQTTRQDNTCIGDTFFFCCLVRVVFICEIIEWLVVGSYTRTNNLLRRRLCDSIFYFKFHFSLR